MNRLIDFFSASSIFIGPYTPQHRECIKPIELGSRNNDTCVSTAFIMMLDYVRLNNWPHSDKENERKGVAIDQ